MIKRIELLARAPDSIQAQLPRDARPLRASLCISRPELSGGPPAYAAIGMQWFADRGALERFEACTCCAAGGSRVVIAEEVILRGGDWLTQRWAAGELMLKHMALARRAAGVSRAELSARWRGHAGKIGGAVAIPEPAKGRAYVQNHPLASAADWAYDAINEVYFEPEDLSDLQARIDFFAQHDVARAQDDLFEAPVFLVVAEHVL